MTGWAGGPAGSNRTVCSADGRRAADRYKREFLAMTAMPRADGGSRTGVCAGEPAALLQAVRWPARVTETALGLPGYDGIPAGRQRKRHVHFDRQLRHRLGIDRSAVPGSAGTFRRRELCGLVDAQNAQIWTTSALIGIKPRSAQNGGCALGLPEVRSLRATYLSGQAGRGSRRGSRIYRPAAVREKTAPTGSAGAGQPAGRAAARAAILLPGRAPASAGRDFREFTVQSRHCTSGSAVNHRG
jgi:hypothetical protein